MFLSSKAAHYRVMKSYVTSAAFFSYSSYYDLIMHQSVICPRGVGVGGRLGIPKGVDSNCFPLGGEFDNVMWPKGQEDCYHTCFALGIKSKWSAGITVIFILCALTTEGDSHSNT